MLEGERKQLDDGVNKIASKVKGSTLVYIILAVIIAALVWKWL